MTTSTLVRRTLLHGLGAGVLAPLVSPAVASPGLTIARGPGKSVMGDVAEVVVKEAFKRSGLQLDFKDVPWARGLPLANEGDLDGDLMRIADAAKTFTNLVAIPTPVGVSDVAIYSMDEKLVRLPRAELRKLKVGVRRGILQLAKHSQGMKVVETQTTATGVDMLANGNVDVLMLVHVAAELDIADLGLKDIYRRPNYWATDALYLHLNKKHAAWVAKINTAMLALQKEGFITKTHLSKHAEAGIAPLLSVD